MRIKFSIGVICTIYQTKVGSLDIVSTKKVSYKSGTNIVITMGFGVRIVLLEISRDSTVFEMAEFRRRGPCHHEEEGCDDCYQKENWSA